MFLRGGWQIAVMHWCEGTSKKSFMWSFKNTTKKPKSSSLASTSGLELDFGELAEPEIIDDGTLENDPELLVATSSK